MLVFDLTSRKSFNNIQLWLERLQTNCINPKFTLILIGNKCDLEDKRVVHLEEVSEAIKQWNARTQGKLRINTYIYYPISAKTCEGMAFLPRAMITSLPYSTELRCQDDSHETSDTTPSGLSPAP